MSFLNFLKKKQALIAIDMGSSNLRLVELDLSCSPPALINLSIAPLSSDLFANNSVKNINAVAERLTAMLESSGIGDRQAVTVIPGPSVFTKRIKTAKVARFELSTNIQFEAGNLIPHNLDAVKIDYHVFGEASKNQLDVLVVAAKNEVVDSYTNTLSFAGLTPVLVDIDYFALQNCFEMAYPELFEQKVALINIGARYASVNICHNRESLFTGDISVGGRLFSEAIMQELGCNYEKAEKLKKNPAEDSANEQVVRDLVERKVEFVAGEIGRQLSLFWNSTGAEGGIDKIFITGGGALVPGLLAEIKQKTAVECELLNPLKVIQSDQDFDKQYLSDNAQLLTIVLGLGLRQLGDKEIPAY